MTKARKCGINTPYLMHADLENRSIYMQYVESKKVRDYINAVRNDFDSERKIDYLLRDIATIIARLHQNGLVHGDLTTSNILVKPNQQNDPLADQ